MQVNKINPTAFQAKFIHTDDLENVVKYAVKHNKFDKLNEARKILILHSCSTESALNYLNIQTEDLM